MGVASSTRPCRDHLTRTFVRLASGAKQIAVFIVICSVAKAELNQRGAKLTVFDETQDMPNSTSQVIHPVALKQARCAFGAAVSQIPCGATPDLVAAGNASYRPMTFCDVPTLLEASWA